MVNCINCRKENAVENVKRMKLGKETMCENLYHMPSKIKQTHDDFVKSMDEGNWGFLLVRGDNGAGKTRYVKTVEAIARNKDYCIAHIELMGDEIKQYGIPGFIVHQCLHKLRLPDGYQFLPKIQTNDNFKRQVRKAIEHDRSILEFWSSSLTTIMLHLTNPNIEAEKKGLVTEWLRGSSIYVKDLRNLGIFNQKMKSFLDVPVKEALYFVKQLCHSLDYKGLLIVADEIEKGGELYPNKGRAFLDSLRDAINILLDTESLPNRIGIQKGLFVIFAISVPYLFWARLIPTEDVRMRGIEAYTKPRTTIDLSPRLHTILADCASTIDVDIDNLEDLEGIIKRIVPCYNKATATSISVNTKKLAETTLKMSGGCLPRTNIQNAIKLLEKE
ncbi:MAG: hypothetical protein KKA79_06695 [Nanoarchaeota archaeon]|nr:hypothetical protein [Nanoarchaeota archaeon]